MFTHQKPDLTSLQIKDIARITIWGVGLIGGSLGLALKKNGFAGERVGLGRNIGRLKIAQGLDAVDTITIHVPEGVKNSDLIVLCPPVNYVSLFVRDILEFVKSDDKHTVLTDVGSTKAMTVTSVDRMLDETCSRNVSFVGGHPMAGSHKTGVGAAHADLFVNSKCLLTPTEYTAEQALVLVKDLWHFVGAETVLLSPESHDQLIGAASHFPHLIASILANSIANAKTDERNALDFTATGFRDTTRIAAGAPELWTSIFTQNTEVVLQLIDDFVDNINKFRTLLETENHSEIERVLTEAQEIVIKQRNLRE